MYYYLIGLVVSLLAGLWFIYKTPENKTAIYLFLSAGGAFLMTIIFTHILPELFERLPSQAGYFLLAGFLTQILLENYSRGIEHGHAHSTKSSRYCMFHILPCAFMRLLKVCRWLRCYFNQQPNFTSS